MTLNGKAIGLVGSMISIVFSVLGIFGFIGFLALTKTQSFIDSYNEGYMSNGNSLNDAETSLDMVRGLLAFAEIVTIIFLIIGIITLTLLILTNNTNFKKTAPFVLILGIIHIFSLRILSAILIIVSYTQLSKNQLSESTDNL